MNKQPAPQKSQIEKEKYLFRYSSALERGDFETVSSLLLQAEADPELEGLLLDLNLAYQEEPLVQPVARTETPQKPARRPFRFNLRLAFGAGLAILLIAVAGYSLGLLGSSTRPGSLPALLRQYPAPAEVVRTVEVPVQAPAATEAPAVVEAPAGIGDRGSPSEVYPAPGYGYGTPQSQPSGADHLIVRSGNLVLVVADTRQARDRIQSMVEGMAGEGAFVVSSSETSSGGEIQPSINMTLRVPVGRFNEVVGELEKMAIRVVTNQQSAQDVTQEYVDQSARLKQLETAQQRLLEIMQEAKTTDDLLKVESLLTQRETEIEALKARIQYLSQTASLSSIQVQMQPSILNQPVGEPGWDPAATARTAAGRLLNNLRGFVDYLLTFAIVTLPWLLVIGLVAYLLLRFAWNTISEIRLRRT
jgi:hypothetical protein